MIVVPYLTESCFVETQFETKSFPFSFFKLSTALEMMQPALPLLVCNAKLTSQTFPPVLLIVYFFLNSVLRKSA